MINITSLKKVIYVRQQKISTFVQVKGTWNEYLSRMGTEFDSCHALWLTKLKNNVEIG
jgi:hypothetical protein